MTDNKENEVLIILHGKEVLKIDPKGTVSFQGNHVHDDIEANKRFFKFFQDNLTFIIEGEESAKKEADNAPDACGSCTGC